jgi:uncharacterized repeat protein (TIGR01451 family)
MNARINHAMSIFLMMAMVLSSVLAPVSVIAQEGGSQFGFNTDLSDFGQSGDFGFSRPEGFEGAGGDYEDNGAASASSGSGYESNGQSSASAGSQEVKRCRLEARAYVIQTGGDVTLEWTTAGYDNLTLNGQSLAEDSGTITFTNVLESTSYTLKGSDGNGNDCEATVDITCLPAPEPKLCEPGDQHYDPENDLSGVIYAEGKGRVTNSSEYCDYPVGLASYEKFDEVIDNQIIFDYDTGVVPAESEVELMVDVPQCSYQIDLFYGDVLLSLDGQRYGERLLAAKHVNGDNYCGVVEQKCELELHKSVDKTLSVPGDVLTYTITVENTGTAKCTGGGVKIFDPVDTNLVFQSADVTNNLSLGYGNQPVYSAAERLLRFNGHDLDPGESGTITWTATIATPHKCGDFEVENQAKATAKELDNFHTWVYSQNVVTGVDNDCDVIEPPQCPYTAADGVVVDFTGYRLLSNRGENLSRTPAFDVDLPAGDYSVRLVAWDGYKERVNASQPNERYKVVLENGSGIVTESNSTDDLADNVKTALFDGVVNGRLTLDEAVTGVSARHAVYPDTSSPNSLNPICAVFTPQEKEDRKATVVAHKVICEDESQLPNFGLGGPKMTANTAADWVAQNDSCRLAEGWEFEWTDNQSSDPGDTLIGRAGSPWNAFGPTDANGRTETVIDLTTLNSDRLWFREILQDGFIPFTHGQNAGTNVDDVSAEFYCHTDVINYDNRDFINHLQDGATYHCVAWNSPVPDVPAPSCDMFTATPNAITVGGTSTLAWETSNSVQAFLNNGIGEVDVDGSIEVSPLADITYRLTVIGAEDQSVDCEVPVTVSEDPVPVCESFTATPNSLPVGGGEVTLDWSVFNAETVEITPNVGAVGLSGTTSVNVTESTTYTLTATDDNGDQVTCPAPVSVADPEPVFSCATNVNFSISDFSIDEGDDVTLTWSTTNVDTVSISGINATALSGSETVAPRDDTTYVLTATQGNRTVECPVSVTVSDGGGGGGGSSLRCDLDISQNRIELGEEIELTWNTSGAREVTLLDDEGEIIFTTDDMLSTEKEDFFDGSITLAPTRDTEYTLLAERGSRDRECRVEVFLDEEEVIILETRDQQPLVAGISLSQVPYTGFEAGPVMTSLFYALLIAWSLFITYLLVLRNREPELATESAVEFEPASIASMKRAEEVRPDVFVPSMTAPSAPVVIPASAHAAAPANLPTGAMAPTSETIDTEPVVVNPHQVGDALVTQLEDRAHSQKALLSSDAVRHFISTTEGSVERNEALDEVIAEAKKNYPLEDGWIVINEARMRNLCEVCQVNAAEKEEMPFVPSTIPEGSGSLAEAIVTGNVVAAYEMIGNRPMFALADAAADLDALYRKRRGGDEIVSAMLEQESASLTDEQVQEMIKALTSALDGTYTDEASAVKMAIMKAVKVAA